MRAQLQVHITLSTQYFIGQLGHDCEKDFDGPLLPAYGDQKTFSLLRTVQKREAGSDSLVRQIQLDLTCAGVVSLENKLHGYDP
jgi:hypothetical protein